jgi:hypothetical protein
MKLKLETDESPPQDIGRCDKWTGSGQNNRTGQCTVNGVMVAAVV